MGLSAYRLDYILFPNNTYSTMKADIASIGICIGYTNCIGTLAVQKVADPTVPKDGVQCFGNVCFTFTPF